MNWFACELHTHTLHSDGDFTVTELCEAAKNRGLSCIALTDHNTFSGLSELNDELEQDTVRVIKGIEWTTFFGHMCVLSAKKYVDWRDAEVDNIDEKIKEVKEHEGVIGVAHPFAVGSPMCTGCYWSFNVHNWENVDYIEVWSEDFPSIKTPNKRAMKMWKELLDKGYRIASTYGKDWHGIYAENSPDAVTYLGVKENCITSEAALCALKQGRTFVTLGPAIEAYVKQDDSIYNIGDELSRGKCEVNIKIDIEARRTIWERFDIAPEKISVVTNRNNATYSREIDNINEGLTFELDVNQGWMIIEIWGKAMGRDCIVAFTSPFYIK